MQWLTSNVFIITSSPGREAYQVISFMSFKIIERAAKLNETLVEVVNRLAHIETQAGDVSGHSN
jgi:F0F1-type ATP synthase alpha subunit